MEIVLVALVTHLKTVTALTDLVSTRVFGGKLPKGQVESMPQKCVVLRYNGGYEVFRTHREQEPRILIFSYGEDPLEALKVDAAVCDALIAISRLAVGTTLIHSVGYSGGPANRTEPDTGWDFVTRSAIVKAGETAIV